jgi:diguanylate cyclase (GGDEF)-like protein
MSDDKLINEYRVLFDKTAVRFDEKLREIEYSQYVSYDKDAPTRLVEYFKENVKALRNVMKQGEREGKPPLLDRFKLASAAACAIMYASPFSVDEKTMKADKTLDTKPVSAIVLFPNESYAYFFCDFVIAAFTEATKPKFFNLTSNFHLRTPKSLYHFHESGDKLVEIKFNEVMARCFKLYKKTKDEGDTHDYFSLYAIAIFLCMLDVSSDSIQMPVLRNMYYEGIPVKKGVMDKALVASVFEKNVRSLYAQIIGNDKCKENEFTENAINQINKRVDYNERQYLKTERYDNEHVYLYSYIKAILNESVFNADEEAILSGLRKRGIPAVSLHPNEYLCWYMLFDTHVEIMRSGNKDVTPFFGSEHCEDHIWYSLEAFEKTRSGNLSELSTSLVQYLYGSLPAFHKVATAVLTHKLLSRHAFTQTLEKYCAESDSVGLIMLDIDFFKQVNEHNGHPYGDDILRAVGDALITVCKEFDPFTMVSAASRHGGEEYNVTFKNINKEQLVKACIRINELLHDIPREIDPNHEYQVDCLPYMSASMGCYVLPPSKNMKDVDRTAMISNYYELIDDEALKYVKRNGRNNYKYLDLKK